MMLHYLLLVSVSWMFCEALHLYLSVQSIFTNNKHVLLMAAVAWGELNSSGILYQCIEST